MLSKIVTDGVVSASYGVIPRVDNTWNFRHSCPEKPGDAGIAGDSADNVSVAWFRRQNCQIQVACIVDENAATEAAMKQALDRQRQAVDSDLMNLQDGRFYKGTLRSGQVLESETSIVILGDVNPGARVVSKGNVIVLGTLKGKCLCGRFRK